MAKPSREYLYKAYIEDGTSIQNIAYDLGTSPITVRKWMTEYEIPVRTKGGRKSTINKERVVMLHNRGLTYREIGEVMNIPADTAKYIARTSK